MNVKEVGLLDFKNVSSKIDSGLAEGAIVQRTLSPKAHARPSQQHNFRPNDEKIVVPDKFEKYDGPFKHTFSKSPQKKRTCIQPMT